MDLVSVNPTKLLTPPSPPISINQFDRKISPSVLLIIVILSVIFFISGILHLLVRILIRPTVRNSDDSVNATALQGQLQELFHLHDSGVDQSFIDTLPVFLYKAIIGLNDPFDCAICLSEFEPDDKLRLLPKCSHAFHTECIDTWLLSHSTCPLCRKNLFHDFSTAHRFSQAVLLLESRSGSSRDFMASNREESGLNHRLGLYGENDFISQMSDSSCRAPEVAINEELFSASFRFRDEKKVVPVKLGNFRNVNAEQGREEGSSNCSESLKQSQRRCYSMGSYEYVMDESCALQLAVTSFEKKLPSVKRCGCHSSLSENSYNPKRKFEALEESNCLKLLANGNSTSATPPNSLQKRESFSVSKTWLHPEKGKAVGRNSSRRAISFHLPFRESLSEEAINKSFNYCEEWDKSGSEVDLDIETGSCANSFGSQIEENPSFARRTLMWIVGRQSKRWSNQ